MLDETKENGKFEPAAILFSNNMIYTSWYKINVNNITNDGNINPDKWQSIVTFPSFSYATKGYNTSEKNCFIIGYPSLL